MSTLPLPVPGVNGTPLESWRLAWRNGLAPGLSHRHLLALREALLADDPALLQGATCSPPPLECVAEWPVEAACPLCWLGWKAEGRATVAEAEHFFAWLCCEADKRLGEPAAVRWFLNWVDDTPRHVMRRELLSEVERSLQLLDTLPAA